MHYEQCLSHAYECLNRDLWTSGLIRFFYIIISDILRTSQVIDFHIAKCSISCWLYVRCQQIVNHLAISRWVDDNTYLIYYMLHDPVWTDLGMTEQQNLNHSLLILFMHKCTS